MSIFDKIDLEKIKNKRGKQIVGLFYLKIAKKYPATNVIYNSKYYDWSEILQEYVVNVLKGYSGDIEYFESITNIEKIELIYNLIIYCNDNQSKIYNLKTEKECGFYNINEINGVLNGINEILDGENLEFKKIDKHKYKLIRKTDDFFKFK